MATQTMKNVMEHFKRENTPKFDYIGTKKTESDLGKETGRKISHRIQKYKATGHYIIEDSSDVVQPFVEPDEGDDTSQKSVENTDSERHKAFRSLLCFMQKNRNKKKTKKCKQRKKIFKCFRLRKKSQENIGIDIPKNAKGKSKFKEFIQFFSRCGKRTTKNLTQMEEFVESQDAYTTTPTTDVVFEDMKFSREDDVVIETKVKAGSKSATDLVLDDLEDHEVKTEDNVRRVVMAVESAVQTKNVRGAVGNDSDNVVEMGHQQHLKEADPTAQQLSLPEASSSHHLKDCPVDENASLILKDKPTDTTEFKVTPFKDSVNTSQNILSCKIETRKTATVEDRNIIHVKDISVDCCDEHLVTGDQTHGADENEKKDAEDFVRLHRTIVHSGEALHCSIPEVEEVSFEVTGWYDKMIIDSRTKKKTNSVELNRNETGMNDEDEEWIEKCFESPRGDLGDVHWCGSQSSFYPSDDEDEEDEEKVKQDLRELDEIMMRARERELKWQRIFLQQNPGKMLVFDYMYEPVVENFSGNFCGTSWKRMAPYIVVDSPHIEISPKKADSISTNNVSESSDEDEFEFTYPDISSQRDSDSDVNQAKDGLKKNSEMPVKDVGEIISSGKTKESEESATAKSSEECAHTDEHAQEETSNGSILKNDCNVSVKNSEDSVAAKYSLVSVENCEKISKVQQLELQERAVKTPFDHQGSCFTGLPKSVYFNVGLFHFSEEEKERRSRFNRSAMTYYVHKKATNGEIDLELTPQPKKHRQVKKHDQAQARRRSIQEKRILKLKKRHQIVETRTNAQAALEDVRFLFHGLVDDDRTNKFYSRPPVTGSTANNSQATDLKEVTKVVLNSQIESGDIFDSRYSKADDKLDLMDIKEKVVELDDVSIGNGKQSSGDDILSGFLNIDGKNIELNDVYHTSLNDDDDVSWESDSDTCDDIWEAEYDGTKSKMKNPIIDVDNNDDNNDDDVDDADSSKSSDSLDIDDILNFYADDNLDDIVFSDDGEDVGNDEDLF